MKNEEQNKNNSSSSSSSGDNALVVPILEDNPCWGSPTHHRLQDLLSIVDRDTSIVYDSPQYLVLNKPPDLRMDGPYPSTVFKLLTYWFPPPSLQNDNLTERETQAIRDAPKKDNDDGCGGDGGGGNDENKYDLSRIEALSGLHQHNDVSDNFLRPCHQLDYATSGVLLVAKTQDAAAHVGRLFEERHEGVQKSYVAIVVGDLVLKNNSNDSHEMELPGNKHRSTNIAVPVWNGGSTTRQLRETMRSMEGSYRRTRVAEGKQHRRVRDNAMRNKKKKQQNHRISSFAGGTFHGFQPAHSIFLKWKANLKKELLTANANTTTSESLPSPKKKRPKFNKNNNKNNHSAGALLTDDDWKRIWNPVHEVVGPTNALSPEEATKIQATNWKELNKVHPALKQAVIRATDLHNDILREAVRTNEQQQQQQHSNSAGGGEPELPTVFRLSNDGGTDATQTAENKNTFYVCCPLAQHPDRFNMVVPSSMATDYPHLPTPEGGTSTTDADDDSVDSRFRFRPSLTKCTILERGTLTLSAGRDKAGNDSDSDTDKALPIRVTKVRLFPITGRRHQLRVHMALTGFPILGDVAYGVDSASTSSTATSTGSNSNNDNDNDNDNQEQEINTTRGVCSRMCLHAQSLELPTLLGEDEPGWKAVTPDPFLFGPDGKLQLH
eukprot:jgi/Psemu1/294425/fgenesh1_pm.19_\